MSGALQSKGTCWLYSIINQFLLSDGLFKVLFWEMKNMYDKMTPAEKFFFDEPMDVVCPYGKNFNKIYFYKFLDQYACLQGGPGQLRKKAGASANLLKRLSAPSGVGRLEGGLKGAYPTPELLKALKTLDMHSWSHNQVRSFPFYFQNHITDAFKNEDDHFFICYRDKAKLIDEYEVWPITAEPLWGGKYPRQVKVGKRIFDLAACTISIINKKYKGLHSGHAICGYVDASGRGYLFDSNQMSKYFRCDWWDPKQLNKCIRNEVVKGVYPQFEGNLITSIGILNFVYVRRTFVSKIDVTCRLKYRKLNFNTRLFTHYNNLPALLYDVNQKVKLGILTQAQRSKIIKNYLALKPQPAPKRNYSVKVKYRNTLTKSAVRRFVKAGYTFTPETKQKIKNLFERQGVPSPINYEKRKTPTPSPKKKSPTPPVKFSNALTKSTVRALVSAGYTFTPSTREKIKNLFAKKAGSGTPPSPINYGNKKPPSPPRKKRRTPTPEVINLVTPSRSNLNKAKSVVEKMKTMKARKEYRRQRAVNMNLENWKELSRYINKLNWQKRWRLEEARQLKKQAKV